MKINIIYDPSKKISNYHNISIKDIDQINNIIDNSCDEIICIDSLDYTSQNNFGRVLSSILSKLRINGLFVISGTDVRTLSRLVLSEQMSIQQYNDEIENKQSFHSGAFIKNILQSLNLNIESENIRGQKYELSARRK